MNFLVFACLKSFFYLSRWHFVLDFLITSRHNIKLQNLLKLVNFLVDGWQPFIVFKTESVITCAVEFLRTFLVVIINLSHVFFNARGNPLFLNFFRIQIRDLQFLSKNLASNLRNAVLWESFVLQKWLMACLF